MRSPALHIVYLSLIPNRIGLNWIEIMPDPLTIIFIILAIAALWILFKILLGMAASLFRIGCFIIFIIAVGAGIWYIFF